MDNKPNKSNNENFKNNYSMKHNIPENDELKEDQDNMLTDILFQKGLCHSEDIDEESKTDINDQEL